jgi:hypothetical protein
MLMVLPLDEEMICSHKNKHHINDLAMDVASMFLPLPVSQSVCLQV